VSGVFLHGWGAVSPAGWGAGLMWEALRDGRSIEPHSLPWPGRADAMRARRVPAPSPRPAILAHPRLRRSSPLSQFVVAAAMEALGARAGEVTGPSFRLGIVCSIFTGCIGYSRRFYGEVLRDPSTASPIVFPETVFNAPASHLGAVLGARAANYTLVGDEGGFIHGMALAAQWLDDDLVDGCLVVGAEEADPITCDAMGRVARGVVVAEGAGAVWLGRGPGRVELAAVTSPEVFMDRQGRSVALARARGQWEGVVRAETPALSSAPCDARGGWVFPGPVLGEGLGATGAWQVVAAAEALAAGASATGEVVVETAGSNEQVIAAVLRVAEPAMVGLAGAGVPL